MKVVARNPKALTLIALGNGEYKQKSVLDQALTYVNCANDNRYLYRPPKVIFYFAYGIEIPLAQKLEEIGVTVEGERIESDVFKSLQDFDLGKFYKLLYTYDIIRSQFVTGVLKLMNLCR